MNKREFIEAYVLRRLPTVAEHKYLGRSIVNEAVDFWKWIEEEAPVCALDRSNGTTCSPVACKKAGCSCDFL